MSTAAQVAFLSPRSGPKVSASRRPAEGRTERPLVTVVATAALGLYGMLRWSTLLTGGADHRRLLGLLALSVALALPGGLLRGRSRKLLVLLYPAAGLAVFAVSGVPLAWIVHLRVAVTVRAIGDGLSALPGLLVPYRGYNQWARMVIDLGAGLLLLDAAMMLAAARQGSGAIRRGAAALPLLALAVIPTTIVHPAFVYLQGALLFVLLAVFLWGDRVSREQVPAAILLWAAAAVGALALAPALDRHSPWLNYERITASLVAHSGETFDWTQHYGPIDWPREDRTVFEVQARRADYWKAASLDVFDGRGWAQGSLPVTSEVAPGVTPGTRARFTQTLKVTLGSISTGNVIAAGVAAMPQGLPGPAQAGPSPGTWTAPQTLGPGDSYIVRVYDPQPTSAELAGAGTNYPQALLPGYLTLILPSPGGTPPGVQQVVIPPFGSAPGAAYGPTSATPAPVLDSSPYRSAYALARALVARSPTPYAYLSAVKRYLAQGFSYNEDPPSARYPIESFLFASRRGYCQQFAGAMALLLRLGGIPARVAVGFSTGSYDAATRRWVVSDLDAHAWVEAFFPGYGWVRFDPTPSADPALGGLTQSTGGAAADALTRAQRPRRPEPGAVARPASHPERYPAGAQMSVLSMAAIAAAASGLALMAVLLLRRLQGPDALVAELERAFARTGRPLEPEDTLASLERRLGATPAAAQYVQALGRARFAAAGVPPSVQERRALRAALAAGLGPVGWLRAWWALPPRRRVGGGARGGPKLGGYGRRV